MEIFVLRLYLDFNKKYFTYIFDMNIIKFFTNNIKSYCCIRILYKPLRIKLINSNKIKNLKQIYIYLSMYYWYQILEYVV